MLRRAALVTFEFSTSIGVAYVAGRIIADLGFGYSWAGPTSAAVFALTMIAWDRLMQRASL
jgi:hypothetical protein